MGKKTFDVEFREPCKKKKKCKLTGMFFVVFGRNILKKVKMRHLGSLTDWGGRKESQLVNQSLFAFEWTDDASRPPQKPTVVQRYHNWHHYVKKDLRACVCDSICVCQPKVRARGTVCCATYMLDSKWGWWRQGRHMHQMLSLVIKGSL